MKPSSHPSLTIFVEPLESRIAPATIFVGDPVRNDSEYREGVGFGQPGTQDDPTFLTPFINTTDGLLNPDDHISPVLGGDPNLFYVKLTTGDRMVISDGSAPYSNFITGPSGAPLKGTVIAVFQDKAHGAVPPNNEVDADELVGLALGKNVQVQVSGTVHGDVIANYNDAENRLGKDEANPTSAKNLLENSITFFAADAVDRSIIAGGEIKGIKVTGNVAQILTGNAADGYTYDINGTVIGGDMTLTVGTKSGQRGPNISNVGLGSVSLIKAGDGGPQAAGGNISNITLVADADGWTVQAGAGGAGVTGATKGGAGGKVNSVLANGFDETQSDPSSNSIVQIFGGDGGNAFAGTTSSGGKGGDVTNISIGFELSEGVVKRSINSIADSVLLKSGNGGSGKFGGAGGALTKDQVFAAPTSAGNDIKFQAGLGGASTIAGGKGGTGGSILSVTGLNPGISAAAQASLVVIEAGDGGGSAGGIAFGGKGGGVKGVNITAFGMSLSAGDGALGITGGAGGSVTTVLAMDGFQNVRPGSIAVDAGAGGIGSVKRGGGGGAVTGVTVRNADLTKFDINQTGVSANGGDSKSGNGGVGGSVTGINVIDIDSAAGSAAMRIRAGDGGKGGDVVGGAGGVGGSIKGNNVITGFDLSLDAKAGVGGNALLKGNGGAGGVISSLVFRAPGKVGGVDGSATLTAGIGGTGFATGAGGKGGAVGSVEVLVDGAITVTAGAGGVGGATGGAGAGGAVTGSALRSALAGVQITAGNAGATGTKKGAGGGVSDINILGLTAITVQSGSGFVGGAGGNITGIGVTAPNQISGPSQSLTIITGNGSGSGAVAGNGGNISNIDGYIATTGMTSLQAGTGGAGATKAAKGGSITEVNFLGGGSATAEIRIEAGHASDSAGALKGGAGGDVKGIGMGLHPASTSDPLSIHPGAIIRHIAAGNGGDASPVNGVGGAGGTVDGVRTNHDIGVRSGAIFGFSTMGGIFAGEGGIGAPGKLGLAGNVTNISADAIAAILAGRPENGAVIGERNLANIVTGIILNGSVATRVDGNGTYLNYSTANLVGAVINPAAVGVPYDPDSNPATPPVLHPHANTFDLIVQGGTVDEYVDNQTTGQAGFQVFSIGDTTNANTDGFVAAHHFLDANGINNVRPEFLLGVDAATTIDLDNTNGQKIN